MELPLRKKRGNARYEIDMTNGPLLGKIIRFSIPLMISGILQLLFNAADMVVVGRFADSNALAAVGATGALINLIVNLFIGFSVGTNVLVSKYFAADDRKNLFETVHTSVLTSIVFGLILVVLGNVLARPMLEMMSTPAEVIDGAVTYMRIYFLGMPVMLLYNFGSAILRAVGDTKRPLYFSMLAGVVNVLLNLFFVIVVGIDVAGVAIATTVSQGIAAVLALYCLVKTDAPYRVELKKLCIKKEKLLIMAKYGLPAGIQGASFSISNVIIQSSINSFGAAAMAGNTAAANIEGFVGTATDAFYQAAMSFTAQNLGAKKPERVKKIMLDCLMLSVAVAFVMGVGAYVFGSPLLSIYTSDPEVISYGLKRMAVVCAFQFIGPLMGVMSSILRGSGYSFIPMAITIVCVCVFRIVWIATVFAAVPTLTTLYISYPVTWGLTGIFDVICYFILQKRNKKKAAQAAA